MKNFKLITTLFILVGSLSVANASEVDPSMSHCTTDNFNRADELARLENVKLTGYHSVCVEKRQGTDPVISIMGNAVENAVDGSVHSVIFVYNVADDLIEK